MFTDENIRTIATPTIDERIENRAKEIEESAVYEGFLLTCTGGVSICGLKCFNRAQADATDGDYGIGTTADNTKNNIVTLAQGEADEYYFGDCDVKGKCDLETLGEWTNFHTDVMIGKDNLLKITSRLPCSNTVIKAISTGVSYPASAQGTVTKNSETREIIIHDSVESAMNAVANSEGMKSKVLIDTLESVFTGIGTGLAFVFTPAVEVMPVLMATRPDIAGPMLNSMWNSFWIKADQYTDLIDRAETPELKMYYHLMYATGVTGEYGIPISMASYKEDILKMTKGELISKNPSIEAKILEMQIEAGLYKIGEFTTAGKWKISKLTGKNKPIIIEKGKGVFYEYTNPRGTKIKWQKIHSKNIRDNIQRAKQSKNIGTQIEGKVGEFVQERVEIEKFGQKLKNVKTNEIAAEIDIETKTQIIEIKKSASSIELEQIEKYINPLDNNFINYSGKEVIIYIDKPLAGSKIPRYKINFINSKGIKIVNSLEELSEVLK